MDLNHQSVLINETIEIINIKPDGIYLDCTFGDGGHSEKLLEGGAKKVYAIDRDKEAISRYQAVGKYRNDERLIVTHGSFSQSNELFENSGWDGVLVDLGPSSRQLLCHERGFSFSQEGPLDMRMDRVNGETLQSILCRLRTNEINQRLTRNTDRDFSKILNFVIEDIKKGKIKTTTELSSALGRRKGMKHPATLFFLALRMLVNDELEEIRLGLPRLIDRLKPGGRLLVISFHSTEDRLVKRLFRIFCGKCGCDSNPCTCERIEKARSILKKGLTPTRAEIRQNPRSRSARLRCVEKILL